MNVLEKGSPRFSKLAGLIFHPRFNTDFRPLLTSKTMSVSNHADDEKGHKPVAAVSIAADDRASIYPKPFRKSVDGRTKRKLGDFFALSNFGVNHTTLAPGLSSALQHHHKVQDEFVYIISGVATLKLGEEQFKMKAGDCMGFPAGDGVAHCIQNSSSEPVHYLEVGDRTPGVTVDYPGIDLKVHDNSGTWKFTHNDGTPYEE